MCVWRCCKLNDFDVIVKYDRDGLNGSYEASNVATLKNISVNNFIEGTNSVPIKSDKLFLLEKDKLSPGLAEDSSASISYRAVLGEKPNADVKLSIAGGDQILVDGKQEISTKIFTSQNWWIPQEIKITANDDLLIEGNVAANINHTFSSNDIRFDGLNETLSVNVIDNDFQRSDENNKMPSDGNNYIIYDFIYTLYVFKSNNHFI